MIPTMFKTKPLINIPAPIEKFSIDIKPGDYIPDAFEPKDFAKAWRVTKIYFNGKFPFRKISLQRDKMIIDQTFLNEDKVLVFPKPKPTKVLKSLLKRDIIKDLLWLWLCYSVAMLAYMTGKGLIF